jgi:hypothetical protein
MEFSILPHRGTLCRQLADPGSVERLKEEARATRAVVFSPRQLSDHILRTSFLETARS